MDSDGVPFPQAKCPVFGQCGGCCYQDIEYSDELKIKEEKLRSLLRDALDIPDSIFEPIVPSPKSYHYRNRLDLKLLRTLNKDVFIGFTPYLSGGVIPVESCPIAVEEISDFIPELKKQAIAKLPEPRRRRKFRLANLTVRAGDDQRVWWGGIGKKSLRMNEEDYLWTKIQGRKIFYSLESFFQANFSILPSVFEKIRSWDIWSDETTFFDLYGGVGLFGIGIMDKVKDVVLIEDCVPALKMARYNVKFHGFENFKIVSGRVEEELPKLLQSQGNRPRVVMTDPPRAGLKPEALKLLINLKEVQHLLYLSCNPETLARDLKEFIREGWHIQKVIPFDFFPKTRQLETLALLHNVK